MRVVIGETGWPSAGGNGLQAGASQGSEGNQAAFLREFTALADKAGIEYFLFSAYDEEWKWTEGFVTVPAVASLDDRTLAGRFAGSSWGIFRSDGTLKPLLAPLFPAAGPHPDRSERVILDNRGLHNLYDMGVDSSGSRRDWLHTTGEGMQMAYPSGQAWGAVFITVGAPVDKPRPWRDFSGFTTLRVEMRGATGAETVEVGIKDALDPDDGSEVKEAVSLSDQWETYEFTLTDFSGADLQRLYVVTEFVFAGSDAQTVSFRRISME
jgi:hypothetical protein